MFKKLSKSLNYSLHTVHLCLPFPAIKHCGISKKDLVNADSFPLAFKGMMKWITNRTLAEIRKSRKKGKQKMFYPGTVRMKRIRHVKACLHCNFMHWLLCVCFTNLSVAEKHSILPFLLILLLCFSEFCQLSSAKQNQNDPPSRFRLLFTPLS